MVIILLIGAASYATAQNQSSSYPVYSGKDLGLTYTPTAATFKIWAPTATAAKLNIYKSDLGGTAVRSITMHKADNGVWYLSVPENLKIDLSNLITRPTTS